MDAHDSAAQRIRTIERYGVDAQGFLDYDQVRDVAVATRPELIIAGGSSYPRAIDFAKFGDVADEAGSTLRVQGLRPGGARQRPAARSGADGAG